MKIVLAPNSFKNSLDAWSAAVAMKDGFSSSLLEPDCLLFPVADGGDHTVDVINQWFNGKLIRAKVYDPLGRETEAVWSLIKDGSTAVIEMAKASGLALLNREELDPMAANTYGTGQLILSALDHGVKEIILGIGGSATVDAGLGMILALGAKFTDEQQNEIGEYANPVVHLDSINPGGLDKRLKDVRIKVMCDVDNPLLGPDGAAMVFGSQKGASENDVHKLEQYLKHFSSLVKKITGKDFSTMPCGGAAGGISVSLKAFLNAEMVNGIDYLLEIMEFEQSLQGADLLVTAEGRADNQTLAGKGPAGVAHKAAQYGVPTILLAGEVEDIQSLNTLFQAVFPVTNGIVSLDHALEHTPDDLQRTCHQLGNLLSVFMKK